MNRYEIPTKRNLLIIISLVVVMLSIFVLTSLATTWWHVLLLAIAMAIFGNSCYAVVHEAMHGVLHPNPKVNHFLGAGMLMFFPAPFDLVRQGHIGHHYRNRSDDEAFDLCFEDEIPVLKWLQFYGILTGLYWVVVVLSNFVVLFFPFLLHPRFFKFDRPSVAFMQALNPKYRKLIWVESAAAILFHGLIIYGLGIPLLRYFAVYAGFGYTWSAMQYVHHYGTSRNVIDGAKNLRFFKLIDSIWLHHNWHHTHHRHPTVPWVYLPKLSQEDNDENEGFIIWHYLRMWRGPKKTDEHVENKYAGKIIS